MLSIPDMGSEIIFITALAVGTVAIFWIILKNSSEKIIRQYESLSKSLELDLETPPAKLGGFMRPEPSLYGTFRDREVSISVPGKGLQGTRQVETVLKIELRNMDLSGQLTAAGPLGGLRQRDSGGQARWKSGDASFDAAVDVRTHNGTAFKDLLDTDTRRWLTDTLKRSKATLYIGGGNLAYARIGLIANTAIRDDFKSALEFLCDLAEKAEETL